MANLKEKQKELKNINGKTDTGGAPLRANDFIRLQQNAKADFINYMEQYRASLSVISYYQGPVNPPEVKHQMGVIISGCQYDLTDPDNPVVSEGYILSGGEICHYPGGTYNTPGQNVNIYLKKGTPLYESRTFKDGSNKEFLVEFGVDEVLGTMDPTFGPNFPVSGIDLTDEVVIISIGTNALSIGYTERRFTVESSSELYAVGLEVTRSPFVNVSSLGVGWAVNTELLNALGSKVNKDGSTTVTGSAQKDFVGGTAAETVFSLASQNISFGSGIVIPVDANCYDVASASWTKDIQLFAESGGDIKI